MNIKRGIILKNVIISGANGFVGGWLVKEMVKHNVNVIALDMDGCNNNLPDSPLVSFIPMNLADTAALEDKIEPGDYEAFYHFAWAGSAGSARTDEKLQLNNALWTADCLRLAKKLGCRKFVCAGSIMEKETLAAVYNAGNKPGMPYIYGAGKMIAHCICKPIAAQLGIDLVWAYITNAYGEGELSPRFVNTTIRKIINQEPLQFTSATQNYDFVHVEDVAKAFYAIGEKGKGFCEYTIGSSNAKPLKEFIIEMQQALAPDAELVFGDIPFTGINMPLSEFDTSDTERDTDFKAEISFGEGVKRTMEWLKKQG